MSRVGEYWVRLDDGTCWAVDNDDHENGKNLNWLLRYGSDAEVLKHRLTIASILSSYEALLYKPQKRRNQIVKDIKAALQHKSVSGSK